MDLFEAIAKRHSYRAFSGTRPSRGTIYRKSYRRAFRRRRRATSRSFLSSLWMMRRLLRQIAEILGKPECASAKAMIVCVSDPRPVFADISFADEDCAASVENMLLAITALGYATVWLDGVLRREDVQSASANCSACPTQEGPHSASDRGPAEACVSASGFHSIKGLGSTGTVDNTGSPFQSTRPFCWNSEFSRTVNMRWSALWDCHWYNGVWIVRATRTMTGYGVFRAPNEELHSSQQEIIA